jgi:hypothetical protein
MPTLRIPRSFGRQYTGWSGCWRSSARSERPGFRWGLVCDNAPGASPHLPPRPGNKGQRCFPALKAEGRQHSQSAVLDGTAGSLLDPLFQWQLLPGARPLHLDPSWVETQS